MDDIDVDDNVDCTTVFEEPLVLSKGSEQCRDMTVRQHTICTIIVRTLLSQGKGSRFVKETASRLYQEYVSAKTASRVM